MPFTLSHAAAALPFRRTRLVMSALVFGCFAPDFEYFLGHHGGFGHTLRGAFVMDLPLAFAALWLFHRYTKEPLAACLPDGTRERLPMGPKSLSIRSFSHFGMIVLSILVGIATHILWDSFTHEGTWIYNHWHLLRESVELPLFGWRPWYGIFQYLSSIFGLVVILIWFVRWYRRTPPIHSPPDRRTLRDDRLAIASASVIALLAALIRAALVTHPSAGHGYQRFMTAAAITGMTIFWIEVLIYGIVRHRYRSTMRAA